MDPTTATFTLVYLCENGHEQTEDCETFEECSEYSVEDVDPCEACKDYGELNYPLLDRIEVNH